MKKLKYSRIFILGVLIYIVFRGIILLIGLKTSVLRLENDFYSMKIRVKAIVVRDEYLVKSDTSGKLSLLVNENEKVQKFQRIAIIYNKNVDKNTETEISNLKKDIKNIEKNNNSLQIGILSVKKEQLKILEEKIKNNTVSYYSNISGVVSYKYDNNEDKYKIDNLYNLTKNDIEKSDNKYISILNDKVIKPDTIIVRIINNNEIYIAFMIKDNKLFNEGDSVKIKNRKETINGEIYKKYKKNSYFITVIKITQQNKEIYDTREAEFDIIYKQMEALRIPKESVVKKENKKGVYVINEENNKPQFVEIKENYFEDNKYIYIDFRKNEISNVDTVKLHDRIILKPNFINERVSKIN